MQFVQTDSAPTPAGHYSQATVHAGLVHVAGQLPIDPSTGEHRKASITEETEQVLDNLEAILAAAGSGLQHLLDVTIFVTDIALWSDVNEVYARRLGDHRPARAVVPIKELHHGFHIELKAVAAVATE